MKNIQKFSVFLAAISACQFTHANLPPQAQGNVRSTQGTRGVEPGVHWITAPGKGLNSVYPNHIVKTQNSDGTTSYILSGTTWTSSGIAPYSRTVTVSENTDGSYTVQGVVNESAKFNVPTGTTYTETITKGTTPQGTNSYTINGSITSSSNPSLTGSTYQVNISEDPSPVSSDPTVPGTSFTVTGKYTTPSGQTQSVKFSVFDVTRPPLLEVVKAFDPSMVLSSNTKDQSVTVSPNEPTAVTRSGGANEITLSGSVKDPATGNSLPYSRTITVTPQGNNTFQISGKINTSAYNTHLNGTTYTETISFSEDETSGKKSCTIQGTTTNTETPTTYQLTIEQTAPGQLSISGSSTNASGQTTEYSSTMTLPQATSFFEAVQTFDPSQLNGITPSKKLLDSSLFGTEIDPKPIVVGQNDQGQTTYTLSGSIPDPMAPNPDTANRLNYSRTITVTPSGSGSVTINGVVNESATGKVPVGTTYTATLTRNGTGDYSLSGSTSTGVSYDASIVYSKTTGVLVGPDSGVATVSGTITDSKGKAKPFNFTLYGLAGPLGIAQYIDPEILDSAPQKSL